MIDWESILNGEKRGDRYNKFLKRKICG